MNYSLAVIDYSNANGYNITHQVAFRVFNLVVAFLAILNLYYITHFLFLVVFFGLEVGFHV